MAGQLRQGTKTDTNGCRSVFDLIMIYTRERGRMAEYRYRLRCERSGIGGGGGGGGKLAVKLAVGRFSTRAFRRLVNKSTFNCSVLWDNWCW